MIVAWVAVGVAGAIAVVVLVLRAVNWHARRVHRRIVSADYIDVRQLHHVARPRHGAVCPCNECCSHYGPVHILDQEAD